MASEQNIRLQHESSSPSDPSNFAGLDARVQKGAFRGLSAAATIYAIAFTLGYLADTAVQAVAAGRFQFLPAFDTITALIVIGYSVLIAYRCGKVECEACAFAGMATTYLVVSSLGIAIQVWGWESTSRFEIEMVSWVGVWLVAYPSIVTLAPRQILVSSLLAWATVPASAVASLIVHGTPADFAGSPVLAIVQLSVPVLICAGVGYAISYHVFHLARDVSRARRLGSYQLTDKIGSGGMGEVWRARHKMLVRPAAIKLIRPESLGEAADGTPVRTLLRRFEQEAQATALLTSPHSILLYDFGISDEGVFYYVMELLEGRDLKSLVRDAGPLPVERTVHFLRAACDSLADAHHRGLIHRDIKPANLFTCRRGREFDFIKVLDFGLVKNVSMGNGDNITAQMTGDNITSGTPGFMAPEMVTGERAIDGRADIYALGCVAYWLLTGQLVFEGKTPLAILVQHVKEDPARLSSRSEFDIPPRLEEIVHACLSKRPEDRPESAEALGAMLAEVAATVAPWTQEHAEKWWRINLPHLHAAPLASNLGRTHSVVNA
ncbi:MAG TPA: serine/threonine-protein kinase [Candidatus Krumholzibacteria bacterium]|nr:serine/threonine-protein kinase [Candidatus Krumholzibacteria bacterium]